MLLELLPELLLDMLLEHVDARGLAALECTSRAFARQREPAFSFVSDAQGPRRCEDAARRQVERSAEPAALTTATQSWKQALRALEHASAARRGQSVAAAGQHAALASAAGMRLFTAGVGLALRDGRLGHGEDAEQTDGPTEVAALRAERVLAVAASVSHTVALTADGRVFSCGVGDDGQLGLGDQQGSYIPRLCRSLQGTKVTQIAAGARHSCAVTDDGSLFTWGSGSFGRLGHGDEEHEFAPRRVATIIEPVAMVAAGEHHSAAVTTSGALLTFGRGGYGRLGLRDYGRAHMVAVPTRVTELVGQHVVHAACGSGHTVVVTATGSVWCCGRGEHGRLGRGSPCEDAPHPMPVLGELAGKHAVMAAAGGAHTVVVTEDGALYAFGRRGVEPEQVVLPRESGGVTQASAGWFYTLVTTRSGHVFEFGGQRYGEASQATPSRVRGAPLVHLPAEVAQRVWWPADDAEDAEEGGGGAYVPVPQVGYAALVDDDDVDGDDKAGSESGALKVQAICGVCEKRGVVALSASFLGDERQAAEPELAKR